MHSSRRPTHVHSQVLKEFLPSAKGKVASKAQEQLALNAGDLLLVIHAGKRVMQSADTPPCPITLNLFAHTRDCRNQRLAAWARVGPLATFPTGIGGKGGLVSRHLRCAGTGACYLARTSHPDRCARGRWRCHRHRYHVWQRETCCCDVVSRGPYALTRVCVLHFAAASGKHTRKQSCGDAAWGP